MADLKHIDRTEKIIGAAFRVHSTLGSGVQEVIYERALELEFRVIPLPYARGYEMPVFYLDQKIGTRRVDFLVDHKISVELRAITKLEDVHLAQAINYLEAYNLEIGRLLIPAATVLSSSLSLQEVQSNNFSSSNKSHLSQ